MFGKKVKLGGEFWACLAEEGSCYNLFDQGPEPCILIDPVTFRFIHLNRDARKLLGISEKNMHKRYFHYIFPADIRDIIFKKLVQKAGRVSIKFTDVKVITGRKRIIPVNISMKLIPVGDKSVFKVFISDITKLKKVEESLRKEKNGVERQVEKGTSRLKKSLVEVEKSQDVLRESEEKFKNLFENANDLILSLDRRGNFIYVNRKWKQLLGYTDSEVSKLKFSDIVRKDHLLDAMRFFGRAIRGEKLENVEVVFVTKGKKEISVSGNVSPLLKNGRFVAVMAILRDITAQKKDEEELKKFKLLVESSTDAISIVSPESRFLYTNPGAMKMYGAKKARDLIGKSTTRFVSLEDEKRFVEDIWFLAVKSGWNGELKLRKSSGVNFLCQATYFPVKDTQGKLKYLVKVERDITKQKKEEEKLKKKDKMVKTQIEELFKGVEAMRRGDLAFKVEPVKKSGISDLAQAFNKMTFDMDELMKINSQKTLELKERQQVLRENITRLNDMVEELKTLDRMKTNFLATASHELKTPLTPLMIQLQLLERNVFGEMNEKQLKSIKIIHRSTKRLNKLITDILDSAKIMGGRFEVKKKPEKLNLLIKAAVGQLRAKISDKRISIIIKKGKIPQVECNAEKIKRVLLNLIDNSVKFTKHGGKIWVSTYKQEDNLVVSVRDNGMGIMQQDMPKLFKPFIQLEEPARRKKGGPGLGLSISRGIIRAHGGRIWAESEGKGKGATFYFSLPIKERAKKR
jgi:PAS domain S-box-containing protein